MSNDTAKSAPKSVATTSTGNAKDKAPVPATATVPPPAPAPAAAPAAPVAKAPAKAGGNALALPVTSKNGEADAPTGVPADAGTMLLASGVTFAAPFAGHFVASKLDAGWPCLPGTALVVPGTLGGAPAWVLVAQVTASSGRSTQGVRQGAYKAWPYTGAKLSVQGR